MADIFSVRLAQEELVYILAAQRIRTIPGLETDPLGDLDADHRALALAVADRTLQARGIVERTPGDERRLQPLAAGVVRACAEARSTLLVDEITPGESPRRREALWTFSAGPAVERVLVTPGVHQLTAFGTPADVLRQVAGRLFALEPSQVAGQPVTAPAELVDVLRAAALGERGPLAPALSAHLPPETAHGLAAALGDLALYLHLALHDAAAPTAGSGLGAARRSLTLAQGGGALYLLTPRPGGDGRLDVRPASPEAARAAVERLLCPALDLLPSPEAASTGGR